MTLSPTPARVPYGLGIPFQNAPPAGAVLSSHPLNGTSTQNGDSMVTDVQVVDRLQARDAQAFCSLIERLQQPVTGYLHRLVGDRESALDLAQDTFLQVYKEIGKTSSELALDAWVYRIATNYGLRYLNRRRLRQYVGLEEREPFDTNLMVAGIEEQAETRILVQQALSMMKPKDAAFLQLHYGDGFTYEEIGRIFDMRSEAVRKRVARGVEKFRAAYGKGSIRTRQG